jgi:hypothetical protein
MKRQLLSTFLLLCFATGYCGAIEKGYEALSVFDYFKAREIFKRQLRQHTAAASFGLATIYYRNDNPFHQLDSAYRYITLCRDHLSTLPPEKKSALLKKFALSDTSARVLHDSICTKAFDRFMRKPDVESAEKYLGTYFRSPYAFRVLCLRDSFIFHRPDRRLTVEGFTNYLYTYPQSCYLTDSRNLLEFALYMETTAPKTDTAYLQYLWRYPKGKYRSYAREELLNYYVKTRSAPGIHRFIRDYGDSHPTTYAWNMLLGIEAPHHSRGELEAFLNKYADYPKRDELEEEFTYWNTPFLLIKKDERHGYCDTTGRQMIAPEFAEAEDFSEGYALVQKNDLYGYINKAGKTKIEFQYTDASSFRDNVAVVQKDKKYFVIDYSNKVLSARYDEIADFSEGMAIVKKNNLYGAINLNGQEIIKPSFDMISDYQEGLAVFLRNGKYGFLDKQGFVAVAPLYDWVAPFAGGQARAQLNKMFGVINRRGDFVIPPAFDLIDEPHNGVYLLVKNNLYGFADSSGCFISEIKYAYQPAFKTATLTDGRYIRAVSAKRQELLNVNGGKYLTEHVFEEVGLPVSNYVVAKEKGKVNIYHLSKPALSKRSLLDARSDGRYWYLENKKGWNVFDALLDKLLFTVEANDIAYLRGNFFVTSGEEGKGLIDASGQQVLPMTYDEITVTPLPAIVYVGRNEKGAYFNLSARAFVWKEEGFDAL